MPIPVAVPRLGNRMRGGLVAEWYHPDGARVQHGDPVCRLECDFVAVDLEADGDGVLRHRMDAGLIRPPGDLLGVILASGERMPEFEPVDLEAGLAEAMDNAPLPANFARESASPAPIPSEPRDADLENEPEPVPPTTFSGFSDAVLPGVETGESPTAVAEEDSEATSPVAARLMPMLFPRHRGAFEAEPERPEAWDLVPGDSVDFVSGLFPLPRDTALESLVDPAAPADDGPEHAGFEALPDSEPERADPPHKDWRDWEPSVAEEPLAAPAEVLSLRVEVSLAEAAKMRESLTREWRSSGVRPTTEDIVVRAAARAFRDQPLTQTDRVALRTVDEDGNTTRILANAATRMFKDAVGALEFASGDDAGQIQCTVTSFAAVGIDEAMPQLAPGDPLALALGAERRGPCWDGERFVPVPVVTLSLAYDPALIADSDAARFLARVRDLVESPYALLADA